MYRSNERAARGDVGALEVAGSIGESGVGAAKVTGTLADGCRGKVERTDRKVGIRTVGLVPASRVARPIEDRSADGGGFVSESVRLLMSCRRMFDPPNKAPEPTAGLAPSLDAKASAAVAQL